MKWLMEVEVEGYIEIFSIIIFFKNYFFSCFMSIKKLFIYLQIIFKRVNKEKKKSIPCNKLNCEERSLKFRNLVQLQLISSFYELFWDIITRDDDERSVLIKKAQTSCRKNSLMHYIFCVLCFVVTCYWKENLTNRYAMKKRD